MEEVRLTFTRDEATVLFEWVARFNESSIADFHDQAEQRVLWDIEAALEAELVAPLRPDYEVLLALARERVRDSLE